MDLNKFLFRFISVAFKIMIALFVIAATVKLGGIGYDFGYRVFTESAIDKEPGKDVLVQVREDTSARELGKTLEEKGLVRDGNLFFLQLKLSAYSKRILPGVYTLNTSMTVKDMMVVMSTEERESTESTETAGE